MHGYGRLVSWLYLVNTALLPNRGVRWTAVDDQTAEATLTDSGVTASLKFRFNETGEIASVFTEGRYREIDGEYSLTPWAGQFRLYEERSDMRIPVEAEVAWQLPDGDFTYWKAQISSIDYTFADAK